MLPGILASKMADLSFSVRLCLRLSLPFHLADLLGPKGTLTRSAPSPSAAQALQRRQRKRESTLLRLCPLTATVWCDCRRRNLFGVTSRRDLAVPSARAQERKRRERLVVPDRVPDKKCKHNPVAIVSLQLLRRFAAVVPLAWHRAQDLGPFVFLRLCTASLLRAANRSEYSLQHSQGTSEHCSRKAVAARVVTTGGVCDTSSERTLQQQPRDRVSKVRQLSD